MSNPNALATPVPGKEGGTPPSYPTPGGVIHPDTLRVVSSTLAWDDNRGYWHENR